jgi:hypothetical protein
VLAVRCPRRLDIGGAPEVDARAPIVEADRIYGVPVCHLTVAELAVLVDEMNRLMAGYIDESLIDDL